MGHLDPDWAPTMPFLRLLTSFLEAHYFLWTPEHRRLPGRTSWEEEGPGLAWILRLGSRGPWTVS